ncbi:MAG TPA: amino acid adenylation domain-containing protein, partial [Pyrinomonadaceae bacterium]
MNRLSLEQRARLALQARKEETTPKKRVIPRRVGSGPAALSFPQSRLWFLDQFAPGSAVAYNIPAAVRLTGSLNLPALEQTFSEIVRRHESLRTTFTEIEGAPMQVIGAAQPIKLSLIDLSVLPAAEREAEARRLAAAEAREAFALSQGPLIRIKLLKLGAQEHVLLITMHHIITDGWSIGIFIREMCALYCAFSAGHPSPLGELSLQYADFAAWQQEGLQGEALEQQLSYWKEQLTGAPPLLELLTDYVRPPVQSFYGGREQLKLSSSLTKALRELSRREGTTMFMTLLAGFKLLLHRLTAQDDIVVGSPIAGRTQAEIEPLIGYFVNMLALRTGLSGELTFRQLLGRVRQVTLGAYAHQDVPFELLVEKLQAGRNPSHTPLFQVLFNMLNFQAQEQGMSLSGLKVEPFASGEFDSKFDLTLYAEEGEEEIQLDLIYNRDLFAPARIVEMLRQFEHLLSQIVSQPDEKISSFSLVTRAAEISLPIPSQALTANWEGALHMPFSRQAQRAPERLAVRDQQDAWTYAELDARSNQLANYLRASGIKPREVVAIYGHRSASLVWAILGVLKAGAAFVILDPEYPTDRLIDCLRLASPRGWLQVETARELPKALEEFLGSLSCCCRLVLPRRSIAEQRRTLADYPSTNPSVSVGPDDLAYIAFTSGSMGLPKGISGGHKPLSHFLQWHIERFGLAESDHFSMLSGLAHDPLLRDIFTPLWLGATLLIPAQEQILDPGELSRWMKQEQISVAHLTPALGQLLCGTGGGADGPGDESMTLASLRYLFVGGDQLTYGDVSKFRAIAPAVTCVNFYGATETPQAMGYFVVPPQENEDQINLGEGAARQRKSIPLGKGIADVQLLVINQCEQLSGVGEVGELYVRTPYLAFGYLNDEVLTGEKFITNPFTGLSRDRLYRTGDLGRYLPNGDIEFLGRRDNQAKIRGYRIELGDVEAVLVKHPSVRDAAVLLLEDRAGAKRLVAYVVAKQEPKHLVREVRAFLRERLPEYMLPTDYVLLEALPLTPNGKIDRRVLPTPEWGEGEAKDNYVAPRTPAEELLADIWAEVLGIGKIGIHSNFFELGGHSLLASQVVLRVRKVFQASITLRELFESPTIAGLAVKLEAACRVDEGLQAPPLISVARGTSLPLSYAQQRLWFLDRLEPGSAAYNTPIALRLTGQLDLDLLQQTFSEIVRRHESLRTTFAEIDGQPIQLISPPTALNIPLTDLSPLPADEREAAARHAVSEHSRQPFNLSTGPLLRTTLLRLGAEEHVLLVTMHHIISDGWSLGVMVREIKALYAAYTAGEESPLADLDIQYADFAAWQREWLTGEVLDEQLSYWKEQLAGAPPVLELPTDRPRPPLQSYRGAQHSFTLSQELTRALRELSQREGCTLFMVLLTAFQVLLSRYSGQEDVVVGTPIANRNRSEIEGLIGFFVNTLALRTDLSGEPSFKDALKRVREVTLGAYGHQDVPFEKLVEELQPERSLSHQPLFQVMMVLQNAPRESLELPGLQLQLWSSESQTTKFDLLLSMSESQEGLSGAFEYSTDLFDEQTIQRFQRHFERLLEAIIVDAEQQVAAINVLSAAEHEQIVVQWNETSTEYPQESCVHQLFEEQVARTPEAIA